MHMPPPNTPTRTNFEHQAIMGWSYIGYMSTFAITKTDRFRASMVGAGVTKLVTYPRQPHGLREPKFIIDTTERQLE